MPLIPSFIARLRTHSQSTAATSSSQSGSPSNSTGGPSTPGFEFSRLSNDPSAVSQIGDAAGHVSRQMKIARKIHPDLDALLDENAAADTAVEAIGPLPPGRRTRAVEQFATKQPEGALLKEAGGDAVQQTVIHTPATDCPHIIASPRSPFLSRILSTPILSGVPSTSTNSLTMDPEPEPGGSGTQWSTFGRHRVRTSQLSEFGSLHRRGSGSKGSVQSKSSKRRTYQSSTPGTPSNTRAPSQIRTAVSTNDTPPSQTYSPAETVSSSSGSKSYSLHSQSVGSKRHPQTYSEAIPDVESPSVQGSQTPAQVSLQSTYVSPIAFTSATLSPQPTPPHLDDSPQTFGRSTPKHYGTGQKRLPEHDEAFQPPMTFTPPPKHQSPRSSREPPWTYPMRSRTQLSRSSIISFPSLPIWPFGSESRSRAEDVFRRDIQDRGSGASEERSRLESFLSRREDDGERRTSADWSAAEAVRNRNPGEGETWPPMVSREIVLLSCGNGAGAPPVSVGSGEHLSEVGEVDTMREGGTKNPTLFGSIGEERRQFFRSARTWIVPRPATSVDMSSSTSQQLTSQSPTVTMTLPFDSAASSAKSPVSFSRVPPEGGLVPFVSVTGPTPTPSPRESRMPADPQASGSSGNADDSINSMTSGKRKKDMESEEESQPTESGTRSILLRRNNNSTRISDASHAPSSFRHAKRIRLSTPSHSLSYDNQSSHQSPPESPEAPGSRPPSSLRALPLSSVNSRTLSQTSIPLRAIVSPKPPSVDQGSTYHMRDPDLPPPRRLSTQWTGGARKDDNMGRAFPLQGWAFIIGFLVFPLWWVAAIAPVGWGWRSRGIGGQNGKSSWSEENLAARAVVEYDVASTWRQRCRLMSLLGLLVYIPLIILLVVLVPRP